MILFVTALTYGLADNSLGTNLFALIEQKGQYPLPLRDKSRALPTYIGANFEQIVSWQKRYHRL